MTQLHRFIIKYVIVLVYTIIIFQSTTTTTTTTTTWLQVNGGLLDMLGTNSNGNNDNSMYLYYNNNDAIGYIEDYRSNNDPDGTKPSFLYNISSTTGNTYHRVITYYSHWCGHCIHFRPRYIEIAQQIQLILLSEQKQSSTNNINNTTINNTNYRIKFYAISCVPNSILCSDQNIEYYPSIHIYKYKQNNTTNSNSNVSNSIPDVILTANQVTVENILNTYLQFNISTSSIQQIIQQYKIIKQQQQSMKRQQTIQSFTWPIKTKLELYNDIYLSFSFFLRYSIFTIQSKSESESDDTIDNNNNNNNENINNNNNANNRQHQSLTNAEKQVLLEWFMLLQATIPSVWDKIHTIITILLKDFNTIFENEETFFRTLDTISVPIFTQQDETMTTTGTNGSTGNNKQHKQEQQQQQHRWSQSCSKGIDSAGYTCGLWQLLHVMTIGVVENNILSVTPTTTTTSSTNSGSSSSSSQTTISFLPTLYVADIIKSVIEYFFQCEECRDHFVQMYDSCAYNRCTRLNNNSSTISTTTIKMSSKEQIINDSIELPLWLMEAHNGVTERIYLEELLVDSNSEEEMSITTLTLSNDEKEIKLWPSKKDCSSCWSKLIIVPTSTTTANTSITTANTGATTNIQTTLHPKITYEYLKSQYWPSELVDTSERYNTASTMSTIATVPWQQLLWILLLLSGAFYLLRRCLLPVGGSNSSSGRGHFRSSIHRGTNGSSNSIIVSNGNNIADSRMIRNPVNRRKSYQLISQ